MTIRARLGLLYVFLMVAAMISLSLVVYFEWKEQQNLARTKPYLPEPAIEEVGEILLFGGLPTALLLLISGWLGLKRILEPVTALTEAVERIQWNRLKQTLPRSGNGDELDRLTDVFNTMVKRLEESVAPMRDFTLHASHELKTPLTIMRASLETAINDSKTDAHHHEVLAGLVDEVQRLTKIIDGLSFLAKADNGQVHFERKPVQLDELVQESFEDARIMAQEKGVKVEIPSCEPITIQGDRHRLRQMLLNLTENAVKYNEPGGMVSIHLSRTSSTADLVISNTGRGIPTAVLPRIFDRFYRGDPDYHQAQEGCGLGLSIVEWIAKAHEARIDVQSDSRTLTTFAIKFPLASQHVEGANRLRDNLPDRAARSRCG